MEDKIQIIYVLAAVLICLLLVLIVRKLFRKDPYPYEARPIVTDNERILYDLLSVIAAEEGLLLFLKMRLADIMKVKNEVPEYMKAFNKIKAKHTDFLLCDPESLEVLVAIELDDKSHLQKERQERDVFVDGAYKACGIPLLHVWNPITKEELQDRIEEVL